MDWELPVIALRTQVVLPRTLENVDVGRPKSKRALEEAHAGDNRVLLVVQRDARVDDPGENELYDVGTLALIKQVIRLPNDTRVEPGGSKAAQAALEQIAPLDSPEREEAIKEATDVAGLGVEKFRAMWKAWPTEKRQLVTDKLAEFQAIAERVDTEVAA